MAECSDPNRADSAAEGHDQQPPPRRPAAEQAVADPDDPVDAEVDHGRRHQGRDRAGGLGMGPGQPHVQRHHPGFRAETDHRQHEGGRCAPRGQVRPMGGDGGEGLAAGVGRPAAPTPRAARPRRTGSSPRTTGRPLAPRRRRRWSTRTNSSDVTAISSHKNRNVVDAGRGRHEQQRRDEQREHARRRAAGQAMAVVAEAEDHGADRRRRPRRRRTGHRSGRGRARTRCSGSSWLVCTTAASPVREHVGGHREPADAGGDGQGDRRAGPGAARGAHRPGQRGGQADQGGGDREAGVTYRPGPAAR